jgi:bile acid-coenzyme A ligase
MAVLSIGATFGWLAEQDPDAVALTDADRSLTRRELDLESNRLARAYRALGVGVDDLVTIALPNSVEYYVACAAIWKVGGVPQPVSRRLAADELAAIVELADPKLILGFEPGSFGERTCLAAGFVPDSSLSDEPLPDVHASSWKAPVSSGSTGRPKIILSGAPATVDPTRPTVSYIPAQAVQLVSGPLHHSAPFLFSMRGLFVGHTIVVLPRFEAEPVLAAIEKFRVTWTLLVPTMMQRIWRLDPGVREGYDVSSLESILHLGAACPAWLKRAWIDWLGAERVWEIYAGTESTGVTLIGGADWLTHPGSVGRAAPGSTFCVLDPDGHTVPPGTVGEIYMRPRGGAGSSYRYVGAESRRVGEWESIGDLGRMDADGYVYLIDRTADVITCAGVDVYPAELEAVIDAHPAVRSSAVIGLPDGAGERVHAVIDIGAAETDQAELAAWLNERYDAPRAVTVELVREPVRDDAGKVRRRELRTAHTGETA